MWGLRNVPAFRYDAAMAAGIEAHWQDWWHEHGTFDSANPTGSLSDGFAAMAGREPFYVLDYVPVPESEIVNWCRVWARCWPTRR